MTFLKSALLKGVVTAAIAGGSLAMTASVASADVVCNSAGECWHVHDRLTYPAEAGVVFHDDAWAAAHRDAHWHWRHDRFDQGYYRNGLWIAF
ncbi:MAG TPA: hypothetical protein VGI95_14195 [Caulobacteraceae bacterium]